MGVGGGLGGGRMQRIAVFTPPRPAGKSDQGVADPQHGKMVRRKGWAELYIVTNCREVQRLL